MTPLHPGHYATRQSYQMIGLDLQPTLDAMDGCIRRWTTSPQKMKIKPVRAPVPISGSRGSHGGLEGRSEVATLNRPLLRGRGAAADTLDGFARQWTRSRKHLPPRASIDQK